MPTNTPTLEPTALDEAWHTYTNDALGIRFDYWCWIEETKGVIEFADNWANLTTQPANGLDLEAYVEQAIPRLQTHYHYISQSERLQNHDPKGIVLEMATIDSRPGIIAFFQRNDTVHIFQTRPTILTSCNAQELGVNNPDMFYRTLESFTFIESKET